MRLIPPCPSKAPGPQGLVGRGLILPVLFICKNCPDTDLSVTKQPRGPAIRGRQAISPDPNSPRHAPLLLNLLSSLNPCKEVFRTLLTNRHAPNETLLSRIHGPRLHTPCRHTRASRVKRPRDSQHPPQGPGTQDTRLLPVLLTSRPPSHLSPLCLPRTSPLSSQPGLDSG